MSDQSNAATRRLAFHHAAVLTLDLERATRFYSEVLGLPILARHVERDGTPRSVWVGAEGDTFLAIEKAHEPARPGAAGHHCLVFAIEPSEREAWRSRLEQAGHPVVRETDFTIYARDPDGALVGFSHYPRPAMTEPDRC